MIETVPGREQHKSHYATVKRTRGLMEEKATGWLRWKALWMARTAVEHGKDVKDRTVVAEGGAGPVKSDGAESDGVDGRKRRVIGSDGVVASSDDKENTARVIRHC